MWGTFEKRLAGGILGWIWLVWMILHCAWQMWIHWPQRADEPGRAGSLSLHRARHIAEPFSPQAAAGLPAVKDLHNPFYPNPSQPAPAPPPVVTRQLELLYQGYYATSKGEKRAFLQAGPQLISGPAGTPVVAGFAIGEITPTAVTLAHPDGRRLNLEFRVGQSIEVPQ